MNKPKGIFLAYRSNRDEGKELCNKLYDKLQKDFDQTKGELTAEDVELKYGQVYLSPKKNDSESFKEKPKKDMKDMRIVFLPMTEDFFDNFEVNGEPNPDSITRIEIEEALKHDHIKFISVRFKGFTMNDETINLLQRLYPGKADRISTLNSINFRNGEENEIVDEDALLSKLGELMVDPDYKNPGFEDYYKNHISGNFNIKLSFKKALEGDQKFPLYKRLNQIQRLRLLNFAGTSFITGPKVSCVYEEYDWMRRWFSRCAADGKVFIEIILTNPHSFAARDAAVFKMKPSGFTSEKDKIQIILDNLNQLIQCKRKYKNNRINIYLTDVALPYGIMESNYHDRDQNHMKIDLYAPCISSDDERPSFFIRENEASSQTLYSFFQRNLENILADSSTRIFDGHPSIAALTNKDKYIIHRGHLSTKYDEHSKSAFECCIQEEFPIEVDLIRLKDGLFVVGRDSSNEMNETTAAEYYRKLRDKNINWPKESETLTLDEFLELVHGSVPILLEIKVSSNHTEDDSTIRDIAENLVDKVQSYLEKYIYSKGFNDGYIAFHSSDYRVLNAIKKQDILIPCGIITMDFNNIVDNEKFVNLHNTCNFWQDFDPDFISAEYEYLEAKAELQKAAKEHKTPILGWTITSEDKVNSAEYYCNNLIVDGALLWKK